MGENRARFETTPGEPAARSIDCRWICGPSGTGRRCQQARPGPGSSPRCWSGSRVAGTALPGHGHRQPALGTDSPPQHCFSGCPDGSHRRSLGLLRPGEMGMITLPFCKLPGDGCPRSRFPACRNGSQQTKKPQLAGHQLDVFPEQQQGRDQRPFYPSLPKYY